MPLERATEKAYRLPGQRVVLTRPIACPKCNDTGLIPISDVCANGRCAHGSRVELCFVGCIDCPTGKELQRDLMILAQPEQRRAS